MGANSVFVSYQGDLQPKEVKNKFENDQVDDRHNNGNSYSGTIGMLDGLKIEQRIFDNESQARTYILDNTSKWGPGLAVRFHKKTTKTTKKPTFAGKPESFSNHKLTAYTIDYVTGNLVPADQITETDKEELVKKYNEYRHFQKLSNDASNVYQKQINQLVNLTATYSDYQSLPELRDNLIKIKKEFNQVEEDFKSLNQNLVKKLYDFEECDEGIWWLVGGWASS
jgi:hypothetical protein